MRFILLVVAIVLNYIVIDYIQHTKIENMLKYGLFAIDVGVMSYIMYRIVLPSYFIKAIEMKKKYNDLLDKLRAATNKHENAMKPFYTAELPKEIEDEILHLHNGMMNEFDTVINEMERIYDDQRKINSFIDNFSIVKNLFSFSKTF